MKIALIGYGKMGKAIERIALNRGHAISAQIDNVEELSKINAENTDVAIEFTQPGSAYINIKYCLDNNIPVLSGTTGWLETQLEINQYCLEKKGTFFYASNYSIGVNIFFKINELLAGIMDKNLDYKVSIDEIHHVHKKDSPSGTAITLAEGIIKQMKQVSAWTEEEATESQLKIESHREGEVPGTHSISYESGVDNITITHTAHSREGFAKGAVLVAEWLHDKKGVLSMNDFLNF